MLRPRPLLRCAPLCALLVHGLAVAHQGEPPYGLLHRASSRLEAPTAELGTIDAATRRAELEQADRDAIGPRAKRLRVADREPVSITPDADGVWQTLDDGSRLWRMRVHAGGATDLRLGFAHFAPPPGATLYVIGADDAFQGPYVAADATAGRLATPAVPGDRAVVELRVPAGAALADGAVVLSDVGSGFRGLFDRTQAGTGPGASGRCNVDVVCPLGAPYPDEVRAVGYYEFQDDGDREYYLCSGTLVADVPHDRRSYFLTAAHCVSTASEAASMVVYWNYASTRCGALSAPPGGFLADDQTGARLRATRGDVDVTLVELSRTPDDAWNVFYAGWDATGARPDGTIGIHHPAGDVKKITAGPAPGTTENCIADAPTAADTHWLAGPYAQGTTEGGSSGSGLFVVAGLARDPDRRLIGTLSGGDAACSATAPSRPNGGEDCYGKLAVAWDGPSADARLRDWLDPAGSGTLSIPGVGAHDPEPAAIAHSTRPPRPILAPPRR